MGGGRRNDREPAETLAWVRGQDGPKLLGGKHWTAESEAVFLDHLAASCNVTKSAAKAGFTKVTVYNKRRTDPGFIARWQQALEQGYARLEMMLVGSATRALGEALDPDTPFAPMTTGEAINLLRLHKAAVKGEGRRPGGRGRPRSLDEVRDSILAKLEALERARRGAAAEADERPSTILLEGPAEDERDG